MSDAPAAPAHATQTPPRQRSGVLFGVIVGLVLGVLIAVLVVPKRQDVRELTTGQFGGSSSGGANGPGDTTKGGIAAAAGSGGQGGTDLGGGGAAGAVGAGGSGGSGGTSSSGGSLPSTGSSGGGPAVAGSPIRGVTANSITIGIAVPDLSAIAALGPGYDQGDLEAHAAAVLAGWQRNHVVPINGRTVNFVYSKFNILDANAARATCVSLMQDQKSFMVIAIHDFGVGDACVSNEYGAPVVTTDAPGNDGSDAAYGRTPLLFTLQDSDSRLFRNFVHWADSRGLLRGKRIGIYYGTDFPGNAVVDKDLIGELAKLGYTPAAVVSTDQGATGGPTDSLAVQKFRAAGVNLAMLEVSAIAATNFMQQADAQLYHPTYIDNDTGFSTTDTAASTKPADQYDGTYAMTSMRFGEWKSGLGIPPPAAACEANDRAVTGKTVDPNQRDAEWIAMQQMCDEADVVLKALQAAGRNLTVTTFVAALESQIQHMQMGIHSDVTFGPAKRGGVDQQRTIQFTGACKCWKVVTPFQSLFAS